MPVWHYVGIYAFVLFLYDQLYSEFYEGTIDSEPFKAPRLFDAESVLTFRHRASSI